jgi:hypothetical protein
MIEIDWLNDWLDGWNGYHGWVATLPEATA